MWRSFCWYLSQLVHKKKDVGTALPCCWIRSTSSNTHPSAKGSENKFVLLTKNFDSGTERLVASNTVHDSTRVVACVVIGRPSGPQVQSTGHIPHSSWIEHNLNNVMRVQVAGDGYLSIPLHPLDRRPWFAVSHAVNSDIPGIFLQLECVWRF